MPKPRPNRTNTGHGGYRRPTRPAAVSGPGALSQRTDGRAQPGQILADTPAETYGAKAALQSAQAAMSLRTATPQPVQPEADPQAIQQHLQGLAARIWEPTSAPNEPLTAGAALGPGPPGRILGDDPLAPLRAAASVYPLPGVVALLQRHGG